MAYKDPKGIPFTISGPVVHGFGRGSKELGIPTANFPFDIVEKLPQNLDCGIYFGWARVGSSEVFKSVISIGWNPYYHNEKKSMEVHILHKFKNDFYGAMLKVCTIGYIRPEKDFSSKDDLITEILNDIRITDEQLNNSCYEVFKVQNFSSVQTEASYVGNDEAQEMCENV